MTPAHRLRPAPTAAADPRANDDVALLRAVPEFPRAVDPRGPLDAGEREAAPPFDQPLKMSLLDHAAPRILPRLLHECVQVPRTSGRLRLGLWGNAQLRFRSFLFTGHVLRLQDSPEGTSVP